VDARLPLTVVAVLMAGSLVSCGSHDTPAVCGSVDDLSTSVDALRSTTVTSSAGASALSAVRTDLAAVKADATSQFAPQIAAVETAYAALESSAAIAKAKPTPASLAASAKDFSTFGTAVRTLVADVRSTC
jgi:type IV pilus biogenesis protein CpaD/CtpE